MNKNNRKIVRVSSQKTSSLKVRTFVKAGGFGAGNHNIAVR